MKQSQHKDRKPPMAAAASSPAVVMDAERVAPPPPLVVRLNLAQVALVILLLLGALARFANLDRIPLAPVEAQEALAAWQRWQPGVNSPMLPASPAYYSLTTLLMAFTGASDVTARFVPALFGLALVGLPWLLRRRIGVWGALIASLALAVSPLHTFAARSADGATIALFAGMFLVLSRLRFLEFAQRHWFYGLWVALGLGLVSAPLFYSALVGILLAWVAQATLGPALVTETPFPEQRIIRNGILITMGVALALGTFFSWYPAGIGSLGNILGQWLGRFGFPAGLSHWADPILVFVRYEPLLFIFGLLGVFWGLWRGEAMPAFLAYWFVGALLVVLLQPGNMDNILLLALPASLLTGTLIDNILRQVSEWTGTDTGAQKWGVALFLLLIAAGVIASLARHLEVIRYATPDNIDYYNLWIATILAVFGLATIAYLWVWDHVLARQGTALGLLAFLVIFTWGTSWWLNQTAANDTRTRWVAEASDDELPLLVRTIEEFSRQTRQSGDGLNIFSAVDSPVLRWYLRDFARLQVSDATPSEATNDVIITPANGEQSFGSDYVGSDFGLLRPDTPMAFDALGAARGLLFRDAVTHANGALLPVPINETRVIVWLRTDLFR